MEKKEIKVGQAESKWQTKNPEYFSKGEEKIELSHAKVLFLLCSIIPYNW
jgi:hypothetical protein